MKFSSNNLIARSNGFRFEIHYSQFQDGQEQKNKWFLSAYGPPGKDGDWESVSTGRSLRFFTKEDAMAFCEGIASGKVSIAELRAAEEKAWDDFRAMQQIEAEQKVDVFFDKMRRLGVDPVVVPHVIEAYREMNSTLDARSLTIFNDRIAELRSQPTLPKKLEGKTLGEYMDITKDDVDVCLVDKDTGEHLLPAICYLTEQALASGRDCYSDLEKWVMTLPVDHITNVNGCPMAVVNTDFNWDQVCFLLEENDFESLEWRNLSFRADCACVGTNERLAFLANGTPFEKNFDASCMDGYSETSRAQICEMLKDYKHVYVYSMLDEEENCQFYVYGLREDPFDGELWHNDMDIVPIKLTEAGQGLSSTLDGKLAWAAHVANKAKENTLSEPVPAKHNERE